MKLPETKRFQWNYPALAFLLPTGLMLVFMFITSCEPFGSHCMLYSDMFHQYYPFFCAFRGALRSGDSLLYSWNVGMGMEYLGLISYYLASPLNWLSVFIPESWTLEYFSLLLPIKLGLASLFFAIMLKKLYGKDDLSIVLFGAFYGMCAWALGYNWNIMWMDTFALLPLLALGTVQLIRDRKFVLYTVTLFLSVFVNYYVGLFVCIFVFLLFFAYEICRFKSPWRFLEDLLRIGVFTILAIGMTAILELPTLAGLQDTQSSVNTFPDGFSVNIATGDAVTAAQEAWNTFTAAKAEGSGELISLFLTAMGASFPVLLDAMGQVAGNMGATISPTVMDGLPNLYCGVFPIALAFLFLLSGNVKLRDKLCCLAMLLFFMVSFIFRQLDYIWHGFHFTNQIPYRFSFLFSFVLLYMAYRAWLEKDEFKIWQIIGAGVLSFVLLFMREEHRNDLVYMIGNLVLLGAYLAAMLYGHKDWIREQPEVEEELPETAAETQPTLTVAEPECTAEEVGLADPPLAAEEIDFEELEAPVEEATNPEPEKPHRNFPAFPSVETRRRQAALAIACVMAAELILNLATFGSIFPVNEYDYPKRGDATASMIQVMKELEDGKELFYRAEVTHAQTLNDSALNYYNGLTTFTSTANVQVTNFTRALGFGAYSTWNRYLYEESSPVTNLFTGLKYLIERDGVVDGNACFEALHSYNNVTLLENQYYLPLGFLANSTLAETKFPSKCGFHFQNTLFRDATGLEEKVWDILARGDYKVTGDDKVTVNSFNSSSGYASFTSQPGGGKLTYEFEVQQEGYFCMDVNLHAQKNFTVWLNGDRVYAESFSNLEQMFGVDDVMPGDVVQVVIECASDTTASVSIQAAVLNMELFREGYEILNASTWNLTEFSNTYVSGTVSCDRDGLFYTSIPQCGNKRTQSSYDEDGNFVEAVIESEGNWKVLVDGKEAEITLVGDCMIGVPLTEGQHTVEFVYENPAFHFGSKVTLLCAGIFLAITAACYLPGYIKKKLAK